MSLHSSDFLVLQDLEGFCYSSDSLPSTFFMSF